MGPLEALHVPGQEDGFAAGCPCGDEQDDRDHGDGGEQAEQFTSSEHVVGT
jgi:hypothetical protein